MRSMNLNGGAAVALALWILALVHGGEASYLTGTKFENCVQKTMYSRYYATLDSYTENKAKKTSQYCVQLHAAPADSCTPGKYRCCNTHINKLKFFPAPNCRGSLSSASIQSKMMNRTGITSIYWEEHMGFDIVKITPLMQWLPNADAVDGAVVCINLKGPCWSLPMLSYDKEVLEYALYDKKVSNYECCPVGMLEVPLQDMPPWAPDWPEAAPSPTPSPSGSTPSPAQNDKPTPSPRPPSPPPPSPKPPSPPPPSPKPPSPKPPVPSPKPKRAGRKRPPPPTPATRRHLNE
ncbi:hypothetical protein HXX76_010405 [Chlamydomonas incerta]|uniref:Pherophorin domain-containing protein n=1 Tax=Chlamydomonas incerta TaxID=51695 RepID=A0A835VRA0_CHLIN|nr:hypothetical protein HXX76_010405 [Chlamydomonas incerta]|eukprot:KAG2422624.1 hypothetical protein HXX76_010405 [Chlamydomonas incerta]